MNPIFSGMVDDVDAAFKQLEEEAIKARFPEVLEEARRQAELFLRNEAAPKATQPNPYK